MKVNMQEEKEEARRDKMAKDEIIKKTGKEAERQQMTKTQEKRGKHRNDRAVKR